jgi:hypothetical protein
MIKHLSKKKIEQLSKHTLQGVEYFNALTHIESCAECRAKMQSVTKDNVVSLFEETGELAQNDRISQPVWRWSFAFATVAVILVAGIVWFNWKQIIPNDIARQNPDVITPILVVSPTVIENSSTPSPEVNVTPEIGKDDNRKSKDENSLSPAKRKQSENTVYKVNAVPEAGTKNKEGEKPKEPISPEVSRLNKFLLRIPAVLVELRPIKLDSRGAANTEDKKSFLLPNGEVLRDDTPTLSWSLDKNAEKYKVLLRTKQYEDVLDTDTQNTEYKLNKPLERGSTYIFKVTAQNSKGEPIDPTKKDKTAIFKIASENTIAKLEKLENSKANDWKIVEFLIDKGMLAEAETKLRSIKNKSPKNKLAQKLLLRINNLRRTL